MAKRYVVRLEAREREDWQKLVSRGKGAARKLTHARILLQGDVSEGGPSWSDGRIAEALGVTARTVEPVRQRWVEQGLEAALEGKKREQGPHAADSGRGEGGQAGGGLLLEAAPRARRRRTRPSR